MPNSIVEAKAKQSAQTILRLIKIDADEIRLVDHRGIYIYLDSALEELKELKKRLLSVGTYYINKSELSSIDPITGKMNLSSPLIDRGNLLLHLLQQETAFQYEKVHLLETLMQCYNHSADFNEIHIIGQTINDIIARRVKLQLNSKYFKACYELETKCMRKYCEMFQNIMNIQMKNDNMIDQYSAKLVDQSLKEFKKVKKYNKARDAEMTKKLEQELNDRRKEEKKTQETKADPYKGVDQENFTQKLENVLELDPMREKDLFVAHKKMLLETEENIDGYYEFISFQEGYDYSINKESSNFEVTQQSKKILYLWSIFYLQGLPYNYSNKKSLHISILAQLPQFFSASLPLIGELYISLRSSLSFLQELYHPSSGLSIAGLEYALLLFAHKQYQEVLNFPATCKDQDYIRNIEDSRVCDSASQLMYNMKMLIKNFAEGNKETKNAQKANTNYYLYLQISSLLQNPPSANMLLPNMLTLLCNLVEFSRIREKLMEEVFTSHYLSQVYDNQGKFASQNASITLPEKIFYEYSQRIPALLPEALCEQCKLKLAVSEYDPNFQQELMCWHSIDKLRNMVSI